MIIRSGGGTAPLPTTGCDMVAVIYYILWCFSILHGGLFHALKAVEPKLSETETKRTRYDQAGG